MKLKIAVVVGPEGVGKSFVLKAFACGLIGDEYIENPIVMPVVISSNDELKHYGFNNKKSSSNQQLSDIDWHLKEGDVEIDWGKLLTAQEEQGGRVKDIVMACTYNEKKILLVSEGDYSWSWLVMLKKIEEMFPNINEHDEVILFCTSRVVNMKDMILRGIKPYSIGNQITLNSVVVKLFELSGRSLQIKSELVTLRNLNRQFDEWVGMKRKTSCKLSNWWHRIVCD